MNKGRTSYSKPKALKEKQQALLKNSENEEWLNIQDLMNYLQISRRSANRLVENKAIPNIKLGGTLIFPKNTLNQIMLEAALKGVNLEALILLKPKPKGQ